MAFPFQGIRKVFNHSSVQQVEFAITRTNLERLLPKSPLWPGAAVRASNSNGAAVRAVAVRCTPRAVRCTPRAVRCTPGSAVHAEGRAVHAFWSEPGASVVLEWLNHIIELVLCCSSNGKRKKARLPRLGYCNRFFHRRSNGIAGAQHSGRLAVEFLGSNELVPRPAVARVS